MNTCASRTFRVSGDPSRPSQALPRSHGAQVAFIDPPRSTSTETRWPAVLEYSAAIARAASRLGVPCWDARAALRAVPNGDAALFVDTMHPNAEGHRLYGTFLAEHVRRLMAGDPGGDCGTPEARPASAPAPLVRPLLRNP